MRRAIPLFFPDSVVVRQKGTWTEVSGNVETLETAALPLSQVAVLLKDEEGEEAFAEFPQKNERYQWGDTDM